VLRGLYAITDARLTPGATLRIQVDAALRGGARLVQYRDKGGDTAQRHEDAAILQALCRQSSALLIINDDIELAAQVGAAGVHLGRDDPDPRLARRRLGQKAVIGASCYDRLDLAHAAREAGVDYVAFGSVFPSPTKPDAVRAPLSLIEQARAELDLPICVVGGITRANASSAIAAGADMLAVISDLFGGEDIEERARELSRLFEHNRA
jgi:thiamine-phosphate pyrophosphorylase